MKMRWPRAWKARSTVSAFMLTATLTTPAAALDGEAAVREAARHFQRGVTLYREADYRGALVEFQRACEIVPSPVTFYNIGETEYQLRDYAGALTAFERYLADSASDEHHRAEVESNVEVLRTRIGHLVITTVPPAADITVDDQAVGKTPFERPVRVSIGHHKVVAAMAGRVPVQRYVDVAAEDEVPVSLFLSSSSVEPALPQGRAISSVARPESSTGHGTALRVAGWVTTGALAAGGAVFGVLANARSKDLERARAQYPVTPDVLNHDAAVTTTFAVLADSFIAAAVVVGGVTLFSSLSSSSGTKVTVGLSSARFETTF
jgi:hypothetical protein